MTTAGTDALELPGGSDEPQEPEGAFAVFRNRPFLLLWLSQLFTQIGGNMVLYGLTVIVVEATHSKTANSFLILSFLVPAVLFSAVAGVYVDRFDKRGVLVATNLLRTGLFVLLWLAGANVLVLMALNMLISTVTVFFAPAEAAMIPQVVPRSQLLAANGVFTLTLNAAFAVGFALLGPIVVNLLGAPALILLVAVCYLVAAAFCWTLPPSPAVASEAGAITADAEEAMGSTLGQLREGIAFIRVNPRISWSLLYLGIAASLVGVLGVLGPGFATESLGLEPKDFVVVVLPLGFGIVMGILLLNNFGHLLPRRRLIEFGLVALGILLFLIAAAGPISRFLQNAERAAGLATALADFTSLLSVVVLIAMLAGIAYAFVAIPAQTQLQEDLPEDVRGRVFGVLNMLVSTASFLPIIIVGPVADVVGTTNVIYAVAIAIAVSGILSIYMRGPMKPEEAKAKAIGPSTPAGLDPMAVATASEVGVHERRASRKADRAADAAEAAVGAATLGPLEPLHPVGSADPLGPLEPLGPAADVDSAERPVPAAPVASLPEDAVRGDPAEVE